MFDNFFWPGQVGARKKPPGATWVRLVANGPPGLKKALSTRLCNVTYFPLFILSYRPQLRLFSLTKLTPSLYAKPNSTPIRFINPIFSTTLLNPRAN